MSKAKWAAASGLAVTAALSFALWPSNCEGKNLGPKSASLLVEDNMTKVCETPLGSHISWPYNPETFDSPRVGEVISVSTGPAAPNWSRFIVVVASPGVVIGLLALLVLVVISSRTNRANDRE